ncbi:hypothetical protein CW304_18815 [Bacillus sp. UFRGS-B20]|nr:hypothetical protein CW304_18815 [Bacillus sp. UFRGS-B20]
MDKHKQTITSRWDRKSYIKRHFTAKEKDGFVTLDFTFNASALRGKKVVVFGRRIIKNDVLVATARLTFR